MAAAMLAVRDEIYRDVSFITGLTPTEVCILNVLVTVQLTDVKIIIRPVYPRGDLSTQQDTVLKFSLNGGFFTCCTPHEEIMELIEQGVTRCK